MSLQSTLSRRPPPIVLKVKTKSQSSSQSSPFNSPINSPLPKYDYDPSFIFEKNKSKIFLGTVEDSTDLKFIEKESIEAIVCVMKEKPFFEEKRKDIKFLHIPIDDISSERISDYFETFNNFIDENIKNNRNIFVHCHMGISRSPSFIIQYLIIKNNMTYKDAHNLVKTKRGQIEPNIGFEFILQSL